MTSTRSPALPPLNLSAKDSYVDLPPLPKSPLSPGGYSNPLSPTGSSSQPLPLANGFGERAIETSPSAARRSNPLVDLIETESDYVDRLSCIIKVSRDRSLGCIPALR
jgi:hypothetical protein